MFAKIDGFFYIVYILKIGVDYINIYIYRHLCSVLKKYICPHYVYLYNLMFFTYIKLKMIYFCIKYNQEGMWPWKLPCIAGWFI